MKYLIMAAVLPAVVLMSYIYKKDRVEKEPMSLLWVLIAEGALACLPAALLETIMLNFLSYTSPISPLAYYFAEAFLVVAVIEEGCKFFFLSRRTWSNAEFNCTFDGIVYSVFVSLGFAALENIKYAFAYGPTVLTSRAIFSIPGHMTFGVFMGLYYSRAKKAEIYGYYKKSKHDRILAYLVPVLLHGFYDFCVLSENELLSLVFIGFVIVLDIASIMTVKRESNMDQPLNPQWPRY